MPKSPCQTTMPSHRVKPPCQTAVPLSSQAAVPSYHAKLQSSVVKIVAIHVRLRIVVARLAARLAHVIARLIRVDTLTRCGRLIIGVSLDTILPHYSSESSSSSLFLSGYRGCSCQLYSQSVTTRVQAHLVRFPGHRSAAAEQQHHHGPIRLQSRTPARHYLRRPRQADANNPGFLPCHQAAGWA